MTNYVGKVIPSIKINELFEYNVHDLKRERRDLIKVHNLSH